MSDEERKETMEPTEATEASSAPEPEKSGSSPPAQSNANASGAMPPPNMYVPGEPKKGIAEFFRIVKERRLLRKDLKAKGIKSRKDFKIIAESLGLVYWKMGPFFIWWHHFWRGLISGAGLGALVAAAASLLVGTFLISTITEEKGSFTVNLTGDMLNAGFVLSDDAAFSREISRLFSEKLEQVNNITIEDIDRDVDTAYDGAHNGNNYVAYTFYIRNRGQDPSTYAWSVNMTGESMGVSKAAWVMVFEDGRQVTYTRAADTGNPEELYGFDEPIPFSDVAYDSDQYYEKYDDEAKGTRYGIVTTPYVDDEKGIVAQGLVENVQPEEQHKYTVVIWLEGFDPECVDDIFGGFAKFEMNFEYIEDEDDKKGFFGGVYRTEYEDYGVSTDATLPPENDKAEE